MPRYRPGASRRTVSSRSGAISENAVVYSSSGGHNHDGANSSLIDVNKYSLWDFTLNTIYSTNDRTSKQNSHIEQFRNYVKNIIINDAFGAAGVTLGDNVINANNIVAGSISTDLLRTDAIKSTNYSYTSGNFSTAGTFLNLSDGSIISKELNDKSRITMPYNLCIEICWHMMNNCSLHISQYVTSRSSNFTFLTGSPIISISSSYLLLNSLETLRFLRSPVNACRYRFRRFGVAVFNLNGCGASMPSAFSMVSLSLILRNLHVCASRFLQSSRIANN